MRGTIALVNAEDGLAAVKTEHGEYTVLGVMEDNAIDVGDVVAGDLESLDHQVIENETRGTTLSVYVEDTELSLEAARMALE